MSAVIYLLTSGQIVRSVSCPEDMLPLQYDPAFEGCIEHDRVDDTVFYVLDGEITPRPEFAATITGTTISGLPIPTTVIAAGQTYEVTDGEADLTFSAPGTYPVALITFPYQDKTVEVNQP